MKISHWKFESVLMQKWQGDVWIVRDHRGRRGYFKSFMGKNKLFVGTLVANEYIAATLAQRLGFPCARLEMANVKGPDGIMKTGLISVEASAREVFPWSHANHRIKSSPHKYLEGIQTLKTLVVFDAWIANIDRGTGENIILYRTRPYGKYHWYLIDHGLSLYGSSFKWRKALWTSPMWDKLWIYSYVPRGLLRLQSNSAALSAMIRRIEAFTVSDINKAIASVPPGYINHLEKSYIRNILLHRKKRLRYMIRLWLNYKGRKEF